MPITWIHILFFAGISFASLAIGWCLRDGLLKKDDDRDSGLEASLEAEQEIDQEDIKRTREALARLHELATTVAVNVGEHSSRVQEISDDLAASSDEDATAVVDAVAKLISTNQEMQQQLDSAEQKLHEQAKQIKSRTAEAMADVLTQLSNRRALDKELDRLVANHRKHDTAACMMLIDIDHFKNFNDAHGHLAGDAVLRGMGRVLQKAARDSDMVARYGGEEFSIVLHSVELAEANRIADRVRESIENARFYFKDIELQVTASVGVAGLRKGESSNALIRRSDQALYAAKAAGRNNVHWHNGKTSLPIPKKTPEGDLVAQALKSSSKRASASRVLETAKTKPASKSKSDGGEDEGEKTNLKHRDLSAAQPVAKETASEQAQAMKIQGISDLAAFREDIHRRLDEWKRGGASVSVILVGIDGFSELNDQFGPGADNTALKASAQFLRAAMRQMDHIGYFDKETFALLLPRASIQDTGKVAERLRNAISRCSLPAQQGMLKFTVSLGVAGGLPNDDADTLLDRTKEAFDLAYHGGNQVVIHADCLCASDALPE